MLCAFVTAPEAHAASAAAFVVSVRSVVVFAIAADLALRKRANDRPAYRR